MLPELLLRIQHQLGVGEKFKLPRYIYTLTDDEAKILLSSDCLEDAIALANNLEGKVACFSNVPENSAQIQKEILLNAAKSNNKELISIATSYLDTLSEKTSPSYRDATEKEKFIKEHMPFSNIAEQINMMLTVDNKKKAVKISALLRKWLPSNNEKLEPYKDACKVARIIAASKAPEVFTEDGTYSNKVFDWTAEEKNWELYYSESKGPKYLLTLFACRNDKDFELMKSLL